MLPLEHPDRIQISFDDHRLVANAGLLLTVTLAQHLGLRELVDHHVDLGDAPGRANTGDQMLTLVASDPRFREGRVWLGSTALTTPMCCAPAGRLVLSPARWRRPKPIVIVTLLAGDPFTPGLHAGRCIIRPHKQRGVA